MFDLFYCSKYEMVNKLVFVCLKIYKKRHCIYKKKDELYTNNYRKIILEKEMLKRYNKE